MSKSCFSEPQFPYICSEEAGPDDLKDLYFSQNSVIQLFLFLVVFNILIPFGLPQWLSGRESAYNSEAVGDSSSIPGSGRSPGVGHGNPL